MKKSVFILLAAFLLVSVTSCDDFNAKKTYERYSALGTNSYSSSHRDAVRKSESEYERVLEAFCKKYYNDCYDREFHNNSLIVDTMEELSENREDGRIVGWNMKINGRHSFKGYVNHNDSPFEAIVRDKGDGNYEITFSILRYDCFGNQVGSPEKATRTIYMS